MQLYETNTCASVRPLKQTGVKWERKNVVSTALLLLQKSRGRWPVEMAENQQKIWFFKIKDPFLIIEENAETFYRSNY